ncbi:MAG: hypothetical protein WDW38_009020 [Sanguina aurantia]
MNELHFTLQHALTLSRQHVLEGHGGCVNRITWNTEGTKLLSGSDDRKLMLWDYPDTTRSPLRITTQHRTNIFGAAMLPSSSDSLLVSCAMDNTVQLHQLTPCGSSSSSSGSSSSGWNASAASSASRSSPSTGVDGPRHGATAVARIRDAGVGQDPAAPGRVRVTMPLQEFERQHGSDPAPVTAARAGAPGYAVRDVQPGTTRIYHCHTSRVKEVKTEPGNPHNFWSAGEDGYVRQYDTRVSHQTVFASPNVLIHTRAPAYSIEVKALDINKAQPHLMAIACGDPFIRIYDRRKLSTGAPDSGRGSGTPALLQLAPPHIPLGTSPRGARSHTTYVNFSHRGDKVIASYHGDHVYSFDVTSSGTASACYRPARHDGLGEASESKYHASHCTDAASAALLAAHSRRRLGVLHPLFRDPLLSQQQHSPSDTPSSIPFTATLSHVAQPNDQAASIPPAAEADSHAATSTQPPTAQTTPPALNMHSPPETHAPSAHAPATSWAYDGSASSSSSSGSGNTTPPRSGGTRSIDAVTHTPQTTSPHRHRHRIPQLPPHRSSPESGTTSTPGRPSPPALPSGLPHPPAAGVPSENTASEAVAHPSGPPPQDPTPALHRCRRAEALLARGWVGDAMWALRDCDAAVELDPLCCTALRLRIRALKELGQFKTALLLIDQFQGSVAATQLRVSDAAGALSLQSDLHQLGLECARQVRQRRQVFEEAQTRKAESRRREKCSPGHSQEEAQLARARAAAATARADDRGRAMARRQQAGVSERAALPEAGAAGPVGAAQTAASVAALRARHPHQTPARGVPTTPDTDLDTGQGVAASAAQAPTEHGQLGPLQGQRRQQQQQQQLQLSDGIRTATAASASLLASEMLEAVGHTVPSAPTTPFPTPAPVQAAAAAAAASPAPAAAPQNPSAIPATIVPASAPSEPRLSTQPCITCPASAGPLSTQPTPQAALPTSDPGAAFAQTLSPASTAAEVPPAAAGDVSAVTGNDTAVTATVPAVTESGPSGAVSGSGPGSSESADDAEWLRLHSHHTEQGVVCLLPLPGPAAELVRSERHMGASGGRAGDGGGGGEVERSGSAQAPGPVPPSSEGLEDGRAGVEDEEDDVDSDPEDDSPAEDPDDEAFLSLYSQANQPSGHPPPNNDSGDLFHCGSNAASASTDHSRTRTNHTRSSGSRSAAGGVGGGGSCAGGAWGVSEGGRRLLQRYLGQVNLQTDIKECVFVGCGDRMVACGSDDGRVYIYDTESGRLVKVLLADEDVVNCVQCHPFLPVLATSGIEKVVRIWAPGADHKDPTEGLRSSSGALEALVAQNQDRLKQGPAALRSDALRSLSQHPQLWTLLLSQMAGQAGQAARNASGGGSGEDSDAEPTDPDQEPPVSCRVS